jgi:hypothetical protein
MDYRRSMALIVGLDQFEHYPRQPGAVRNSDGMASCLRWAYKFEVAILANQQASRGAFTREMTRLAEADRVVIYYSGLLLPDHETLCLYNTNEKVTNSGIVLSRWFKQLEALPAPHVMVILDIPLPPRADLYPPSSPATSEGKVRWILAAGESGWTTRERWGDEDATPFTAQVILGLRGSAADDNGAITGAGLSQYVLSELPLNSKSKLTGWAGLLTPPSTQDLVFRESTPPPFPYEIDQDLRSGSPFHRYRAVELLSYLVDRGDPILSVRAIDKLREIANDSDSANVRKMAVNELIIRKIDPIAGDVPRLREPNEPRSGAPNAAPPSTRPPAIQPADRRQSLIVGLVMILVFVVVSILIWRTR